MISRFLPLFLLLIQGCHSGDSSSSAIDGQSKQGTGAAPHIAPTSAQPIRIGIIASLSGGAREQGQGWSDCAQLAAKRLTRDGLPVELVVEDDASMPAKVATAFARLASVEKVQAIVGGTWDFLAEAAYPLAAQYRIPFITPTNPVEILSESAVKNPYIFTNGLSLAAEQRALAKFLARKTFSRVAILAPNVPFGTSHAQMFRSLASELKLSVVLDQEFDMAGAEETIKLLALKLKQHMPDVVYFVSDYAGIDLLASEMHRLQIRIPIIDTQHLDAALTHIRDKSLLAEAYGVYPEELSKNLGNEFEDEFGTHPKVFCANGYDAVVFLANAIKAGVELHSPDAHFSLPGVLGTYRLPAPSRELVQTSARIMTSASGEFHPWSEEEP